MINKMWYCTYFNFNFSVNLLFMFKLSYLLYITEIISETQLFFQNNIFIAKSFVYGNCQTYFKLNLNNVKLVYL